MVSCRFVHAWQKTCVKCNQLYDLDFAENWSSVFRRRKWVPVFSKLGLYMSLLLTAKSQLLAVRALTALHSGYSACLDAEKCTLYSRICDHLGEYRLTAYRTDEPHDEQRAFQIVEWRLFRNKFWQRSIETPCSARTHRKNSDFQKFFWRVSVM